MNTFIIMWNPDISDWKMDGFESSLCHFDDVEVNWAIYDYKKAKVGDRFFMVKCGEGNTGIVMSGFISSKPYKDEDWSGKGREVYYVKMDLGTMIHPDREEILTTEKLEEAIPDFDWSGGHSGRLLDKISAGKLELLWKAYVNENELMFEKGFAKIDEWTENDAEEIIDYYLRKKHGKTCECCGFNYKKVHGRGCKETIDYVRLDTTDYDDAEALEASYHALCPNCQRIIKSEEDLVRLKADEATVEFCGGLKYKLPNIDKILE